MIRSMTAFGSSRSDTELGTLTLELRSVNSRFLDLYFRVPDDLRQAEQAVRELLSARLTRGKVEIRISYARPTNAVQTEFDPQWLATLAKQLANARVHLPELEAPRLGELLAWQSQRQDNTPDNAAVMAEVMKLAGEALDAFEETRQREGARLASAMLACADQITQITELVTQALPQLLQAHREKLATKLRETLEAAAPGGFAQISGTELSERLQQETTLFALRIDVAEELTRLKAHLEELRSLLAGGGKALAKGKTQAGVGKRLDFLFQEMNREANTLGSKAASLEVTRAAMDLKMLIEQLREQAQNLE